MEHQQAALPTAADMETLMIEEGRHQREKQYAKARQFGRESSTKAGQTILRGTTDRLAERIKTWLSDEANRGRGRKHSAYPFINRMEPQVVAYIAARTILDGVSSARLLQTVAVAIARNLEDEELCKVFSAEMPRLLDKILEQEAKAGTPESLIRKRLHRTAVSKSVKFTTWDSSAKHKDNNYLVVGVKLIDLFIEATGLCKTYYDSEVADDTTMFLAPTEKAMEWLGQQADSDAAFAPLLMPMVERPADWTGIWRGGYRRMGKPYAFIKSHNRNYLEELQNRWDDLQPVASVVNAIQSTPWKINTAVLGVLEQLTHQKLRVAGLEKAVAPEKPVCKHCGQLPVKPHACFENNPDSVKEFRALRNTWRVKQRVAYSHGYANTKLLYVARTYADFPEIFFPHQLDWRGRIYPMPQYLHPQGNDLARGLIQFAKGKPLGETGAYWFQVGGAGLAGIDKVSFDQRVEWVKANHARILSVAADPYGDLWWTELDSPFCFLGWAFEYARWQEEGDTFVSYLPIQADGSCNGLQHWSSLLRDAIGGAAVNLVPSDLPNDIYQRVADRTIEKLQHLAVHGVVEKDNDGNVILDEKTFAQQWLDYGLNRKIAKRPVMILPYSGTQLSACSYIIAHVNEAGGPVWEDGTTQQKLLKKACRFLTKHMWKAIGEIVIAAREGMQWITKIARLAAKSGLPLIWTTPMGLPVSQCYRVTESRRIETFLCGSVVRLSLAEETDVLDINRQVQGISPNFVHSLDAAALQLWVVKMKAAVPDVALSCIHDSFGTHACDYEASAKAIRESFREIHSQDLLGKFLEEVRELIPADLEIPPVPTFGDLDLAELDKSLYFFA